MRFTPPQKITIVESIIQQVVAQIQDETLLPGDRLPSERQLITMLGVSRSSVREALQGLAALDLVEIRPGEGTFVKEPSLRFGTDTDIEVLSSALQKEMRQHLNQARLVLEEGIVALATGNASESGIEDILDALNAYAENGDDVARRVDWEPHDRIHLAIAQATGNPVLVRILQTLLDLVPNSLRDKGLLQGSTEEIRQAAQKERTIHVELCAAVIRGDVSAAREWLRRHAEHEEQVIAGYYGNSPYSRGDITE